MTKSPKILAIGAARIDRRGRISGSYVPAASNPGTMREDVGGSAFNALCCAVRRGACGSLLSVRGGDALADRVSLAIAGAGIADLSAVFLDRATPSHTVLLDRDGAPIAGLADMGLYELALPKQIRRAKVREAITAADAILCDASLPSAALERLAGLAVGKPIFAIAVSPDKAARLTSVLGSLALAFMDRREAIALAGSDATDQGLVDGLRRAGLRSGVVTAGDGLGLGFDETGAFSIPPPTRKIVDAAGAGDALAGATVAALLHGQTLRAALREGVAAAMLASESTELAPAFTAAAFAEALTVVPEAREVI